ncbi:MAG: dihydroorotase [Legionellaceae bacterium]|nr:dihydroorotase [Legionellaceae bacterium]
MRTLTITRPDDWHVHFRDNEALSHTVTATAAHFARALVMPNLQPALTTIQAVTAYRKRILEVLCDADPFQPFMSLYLNETVTTDDLVLLKHYPYVLGAKLYPAGATTNSSQGATCITALYPHFEAMQACDLVLQIHGEVTHGDIFERESVFIQTHLTALIRNFPRLRIVLEHISTQAAVDFVTQAPANVVATITPHHLLFNRNQLLAGGIKPHYYCLPILKHKRDQLSLQRAAVSNNPKFFAGTDSAPHAFQQKESACGCAGVYSAPFAVAMYAQIFDTLGGLDKLESFMSNFGAEFYHLPSQSERIELIQQQQTIPLMLPFGNKQVVPLAAGSTLQWSIHDIS